jgi:hypothetical protein
MEPSIRDQVLIDLYGAVTASRKEESYLSLESLAAVLADSLKDGEPLLLANHLTQYEEKRLTAEVGSF